MPPDLISGRDIELIAVGLLSLLACGWWGTSADGALNVTPLSLFLGLSVLSFWLAWWDIRSRGSLSRIDQTGGRREKE